jgi:flagellar export protein FliJ
LRPLRLDSPTPKKFSMAEFQFRLATVLRFRERSKEEREWELGSLFDARVRKEQEIADLEREWLRAESVDAAADGEILAPMDLQRHASYIQTLARRTEIKRAELGPIDSAIAAKREELVEALRSVKTLEQLRQRWAEKFRREQNAQEQKQADEVGQRKFVRRDGGQSLP